MEIPHESRLLAKAERLRDEQLEKQAGTVRQQVIGQLEALYVDALRRDDVIAAKYFRENILILYPDWKFKGGEAAKNSNGEAK